MSTIEPRDMTSQEMSSGDKKLPKSDVHYAYIDGARALLATWVVLCHIQMFTGLGLAYGKFEAIAAWLRYAHLAVDCFIVISGFCLISPVASSVTIKGGVLGFYLRRSRRILPPFFAALFFSLAYAVLLNHAGTHRVLIGPKSILANILLLQDYIPAYNLYDPPMWSVATEWKIYFLFPLLVCVLRKLGPIAMVLSAFGLAVLHTWLVCLVEPHRSFMSLSVCSPWYFALFGLGMFAGFVCKSSVYQQNIRKWSPIGACIFGSLAAWQIAVSGKGYSDALVGFSQHVVLIDVLVGAGFASLMAAISLGRINSVRSALSCKPLVFFGTYSYSIYLMHFPILMFLRASLDRFHFLDHSALLKGAVVAFGGLAAVFLLSYTFFLAFEKPFLTQRKVKTTTGAPLDPVAAPVG